MNAEKLIQKAESGAELTVEEIIEYNKIRKPKNHVYGKYGNLAKEYIENHNTAMLLTLAGHLPEYLHEVDRQADEMYETMHEKLSSLPKYQKTTDFMRNLQIEEEIKTRIHEEILSKIVYLNKAEV